MQAGEGQGEAGTFLQQWDAAGELGGSPGPLRRGRGCFPSVNSKHPNGGKTRISVAGLSPGGRGRRGTEAGPRCLQRPPEAACGMNTCSPIQALQPSHRAGDAGQAVWEAASPPPRAPRVHLASPDPPPLPVPEPGRGEQGRLARAGTGSPETIHHAHVFLGCSFISLVGPGAAQGRAASVGAAEGGQALPFEFVCGNCVLSVPRASVTLLPRGPRVPGHDLCCSFAEAAWPPGCPVVEGIPLGAGAGPGCVGGVAGHLWGQAGQVTGQMTSKGEAGESSPLKALCEVLPLGDKDRSCGLSHSQDKRHPGRRTWSGSYSEP